MQHKCHIESFHPCIRAMLHESPKSNMVKTTCGCCPIQALVLARKCTLKPSSTDSARVEICWKTWWNNKSWLLPLTKHRSALNWCREVCRFLVHRLGSSTSFLTIFFPQFPGRVARPFVWKSSGLHASRWKVISVSLNFFWNFCPYWNYVNTVSHLQEGFPELFGGAWICSELQRQWISPWDALAILTSKQISSCEGSSYVVAAKSWGCSKCC